MSDTATARHPDVTAVRRNPGTGVIAGRQCIRCGSRTTSQQGWGAIFYAGQRRMVCPKCVAEKAARQKKEAA